MNKPECIILHHSASHRTTTVQDINGWHRNRGFNQSRLGFFVGYHYVITADGVIHQTRMIDEVGAHCKAQGMNFKSIGVCITGNFNDYEPTIEQIQAVRKLVTELRKQYGNLPNYPHRHFSNTDCFGTRLSDDYFDRAFVLFSWKQLLKQWYNYLTSIKK